MLWRRLQDVWRRLQWLCEKKVVILHPETKKTMSRYAIYPQFFELLKRMGVPVAQLLQRAGLPEDLLARKNLTLPQAEYFRMLEVCGEYLPQDDAIVRLATSEHIETLLPPVYAAYCGNNGLNFLRRFVAYKRLAVPLRTVITEHEEQVEICLYAEDENLQLPPFFVELALLFLVGVLRNATGVKISPSYVETVQPIKNKAVVEWLNTECVTAKRDCIVFRASDLNIPFTTQNDALLEYMEPELKRRLSEMEASDSMATRVGSVLVELLPKGKSTLGDVAERLCMSRRTLQRKLTEENTSFQDILSATRFRLADNYIRQTDRTSDELAFLLGYEDTNAFLRAFSQWAGMSVGEYKRQKAEYKLQ